MEAERGSEPPTAREDEAAQVPQTSADVLGSHHGVHSAAVEESETVEEVDTPMPEASTNADEEERKPSKAPSLTHPSLFRSLCVAWYIP